VGAENIWLYVWVAKICWISGVILQCLVDVYVIPTWYGTLGQLGVVYYK